MVFMPTTTGAACSSSCRGGAIARVHHVGLSASHGIGVAQFYGTHMEKFHHYRRGTPPACRQLLSNIPAANMPRPSLSRRDTHSFSATQEHRLETRERTLPMHTTPQHVKSSVA
ncbi:uncharacterized protein [Physcomitrium patens]|uniref:Uncharacterized protein n=1 Tax=Physcomitrium patens TaxID=3218 RepID=A0A7I4ARS6_PHYPA